MADVEQVAAAVGYSIGDLGGRGEDGRGAPASGEVGVGAGERVDAVVVAGVQESGQLVEERPSFGGADESDEAVFCGGRGGVRAGCFRAGWPAAGLL